jgi:hypothetical protein
MRRWAVRGQAGNHPTLVAVELPDRTSGRQNDHFRVWPWLEINVIARIDAATGI